MSAQVWATNTQGGYMYSDQLSDDLRTAVQPVVRFRQFADVKDAMHQGKHKGANFHWNVYSDIATQGDTLVETNTMPESGFTITQGTLTIQEGGNSVPYTEMLDNLSYHPVREVVTKVLKNDAKKFFDNQASAQFDLAKLRAVPSGGTSTTAITITTDATATLTNNAEFQKEHGRLISIEMKERNIPPYVNDDYYALTRPATLATFRADLEGIRQYTDIGFQMVMNGEAGRFEGIRYVEQTHQAEAGLGTASSAWTNSKSDWIAFFGEDTVAEAIACPEEIRGKLPGDYGRDRGVAWYYLGGFALVHTDAAQSRLMIWDSAA